MIMNEVDFQVFDTLFREACQRCYGHAMAEPLTETESRLMYARILDDTGLVIGWKSIKNYSLFVLSPADGEVGESFGCDIGYAITVCDGCAIYDGAGAEEGGGALSILVCVQGAMDVAGGATCDWAARKQRKRRGFWGVALGFVLVRGYHSWCDGPIAKGIRGSDLRIISGMCRADSLYRAGLVGEGSG